MKTPGERATAVIAATYPDWPHVQNKGILWGNIERAIREAVAEDREAREVDQGWVTREVPLAGVTGTIERLEADGWIVDNPRVRGERATIRARPRPKP